MYSITTYQSKQIPFQGTYSFFDRDRYPERRADKEDEYYEDEDIVFHNEVPEAVKGVIHPDKHDAVKV